MRITYGPRVDATILGTASLLALAMGPSAPGMEPVGGGSPPVVVGDGVPAVDLVGRWASPDQTVRLNLWGDGRYDRSLVGRDRSAHGTYRVNGTSVLLRDDSGLRTTVTVLPDGLEVAGHQLLRA